MAWRGVAWRGVGAAGTRTRRDATTHASRVTTYDSRAMPILLTCCLLLVIRCHVTSHQSIQQTMEGSKDIRGSRALTWNAPAAIGTSESESVSAQSTEQHLLTITCCVVLRVICLLRLFPCDTASMTIARYCLSSRRTTCGERRV